LINLKFSERINFLENSVTSIPGYFEIIEQKRGCTNVEEVTEELDLIILNQMEGIIIKSPDSLYLPGKRSLNWIKVKPEYIENLCDDLDVVVIGAFYSRVQAGTLGKPSTFLCGVINQSTKQVIPFCKFGSGYNSDEWTKFMISSNFHLHLKPFNPSRIPDYLDFPEKSYEKPDLILDNLENGIVVQLKASQIIPSKSYKTELTLRHPRFVRYRPEREPKSVMTLSGNFTFLI
jgi:DNA ligase-4